MLAKENASAQIGLPQGAELLGPRQPEGTFQLWMVPGSSCDFFNCGKTHLTQLTIFTISSTQFSDTIDIHIMVQPSRPSMSRGFSSQENEQ